MPIESLETLRLLTNLETEKRKLAQVILFGQPELDDRLSQESIRQLRQRITFQHHMGVLTRPETEHYLAHRLAIAGYSGDRVFDRAAVNAIFRASRGLPRLTNILANKALMLAYGEGTRSVSGRLARYAVADTPASFALSRAWLWLAIACIAFSSIGWVILR
jgi:MSHA biogenesis protein MshM